MTRLIVRPRPFTGWIGGLVQDSETDAPPLGSIEDGRNFVPTAAGRQQTRGGMRIMLTLHDDVGAEGVPVAFLDDFDDADGTALTDHAADIPSGADYALGDEALVTGATILELDTRGGVQGLYVRFTADIPVSVVDTYTDSNGTTLDNHSPPGTALTYDAEGANFTIQVNRARPNPLVSGAHVTFLNAPALPQGSVIGNEFYFDVLNGTDFAAGAELGIVILSNADGTDSLRLVFGRAGIGGGPGLTLRREVGGLTTDTVFLGTTGGFGMTGGQSGRMGITVVSLSQIDMWKEDVGGGNRLSVNSMTISNPTNYLVLSQGYFGLYYTGNFDGTSSWIDNVTVNGVDVTYDDPTIYQSNATVTYVAGQDIAMLVNVKGSGTGTYYSDGLVWGIRFCRSASDPDGEYLLLSVGVDGNGATTADLTVHVDNSLADSGIALDQIVNVAVGQVLVGVTIGAALDTLDVWYALPVDFDTHIPITTLTADAPGALTALLSNHTIALEYPGTYSTVPTTELELGLVEVFARGPAAVMEGEISQVPLITPFTPTGAVAVGWSQAQAKHYAYRLTSDAAFFTGSESTSRTDLSDTPSTSWDNALASARPVAAELFEKLFIADATVSQPSRNEFLSFDSTGAVLRPTFAFAAGSPSALTPFCLEEYNGVLFLAGYGDEGDKDRPEMLRHSFLAKSPDDADGFDQDAFLLLGAKGQRVTGLRKGRGLLLAAKDNEFYRITGFGRAYPGWQYQVENIQNTTGLGVSNPLALTFAEGFWYGVGAQGPFRTDGYTVESLVGPRQRAWRAITRLDHATVTYHPERRVVLFGMVPPLDFQVFPAYGGVYPWRQWIWDIDRSVWQTDWQFDGSHEIWMASAVSTTTATGPSAAPSAPVTSLQTVSGYTATWVNGDATAETEFWQKIDTDGTWLLMETLAAGVVSSLRTLHSHQLVDWKVRHRKSGVVSNYTAETLAQSNLRTSTLTVKATLSATQKIIGGFCDGRCVMNLERFSGMSFVPYQTQAIAALPTYADVAFSFTVPTGFSYRVRASDAAWSPVNGANSGTLVLP